ncbi:MAG TPA: hypothetical protein VG265_09075 [Gaiellaceae bacterium]|nr:hypothetical protein [Gaiellaceae bacterium]
MVSASRYRAHFDVYGLTAGVSGGWSEAIEALDRDFGWFRAAAGDSRATVEVELEQRELDWDAFGETDAEYVTEQYAVYRLNGRTVVDHLEAAASTVEGGGRRMVVEGVGASAARRAAFDFILARACDHLDSVGLSRLFSLGLGGAQGGVAVLLPPGGGKTTLALRALQADGVTLYSEGSPLLDRNGSLHPFPFPLWIRTNARETPDVPDEFLRRIDGRLTDPLLLELDAFADRIAATPTALRHVVLGSRSLGRRSWLEPAPRRDAAGPLLRQAVLGFSVGDALRFLARPGGARDAAKEQREPDERQAPAAATASRRAANRLLCCRAVLAQARVWRLHLGHDREGAWRALEPLLR